MRFLLRIGSARLVRIARSRIGTKERAMSHDEIADDGYDPDSKVAKLLSKHPKTLPRWDKNPRLQELGWPPPVYFNGRRHRHRPAVQKFLRNAAAAHLTPPFKT